MADEGKRSIMAEGRYIRLVRDAHWEYAERVHPRPAVVIIAVTDDRRMVMVEQFRIPVQGWVMELPAGLVGDIPGQEDERAEVAARRELIEETGYEATDMIRLVQGPPSAGLSNEMVTFYRATGLRKVGPGGGDEREQIRVCEVPLDGAHRWLTDAANRGLHIDVKVYIGLYFALLHPS